VFKHNKHPISLVLIISNMEVVFIAVGKVKKAKRKVEKREKTKKKRRIEKVEVENGSSGM